MVLPTTYYKNTSLEKALDHLFIEADRAYRDGANILILSDRGIDENHVAIPSLLAVSGLQQHLVKTKKRTCSCHHSGIRRTKRGSSFCNIAWFGASAINPYLAQDTVKAVSRRAYVRQGLLCSNP